MFSFESCEPGLPALCASINCERRSAQAIPAGPPPTMTTSASICGRSTFERVRRKNICKSFELRLSLLDLFQQWGNDIEDVAYHADIGDLKDRRLGIFIDSHDRA